MSTSAETRTSPFDQIIALEREQEQRVRDALAALEEERIAEEASITAAHRAQVEQATTSERAGVERFKNEEVPRIANESEGRASQNVARIKRDASSHASAAATLIVNYAMSPSFSHAL